MIRRIFASLRRKGTDSPTTDNREDRRMFPEKDRQSLFERRAARVCNRDREQAAIMVRKLTILAEGRK